MAFEANSQYGECGLWNDLQLEPRVILIAFARALTLLRMAAPPSLERICNCAFQIGVFTVDSNGRLRDCLKNSLRKLFFVGRVRTGAEGEFKRFQL
jgi:hypothetical protein